LINKASQFFLKGIQIFHLFLVAAKVKENMRQKRVNQQFFNLFQAVYGSLAALKRQNPGLLPFLTNNRCEID
jgi:hypothetical protein